MAAAAAANHSVLVEYTYTRLRNKAVHRLGLSSKSSHRQPTGPRRPLLWISARCFYLETLNIEAYLRLDQPGPWLTWHQTAKKLPSSIAELLAEYSVACTQ